MSLDTICSLKLLEEQISFSSFSETSLFFSNGSYCLYILEPNGEVMRVDQLRTNQNILWIKTANVNRDFK